MRLSTFFRQIPRLVAVSLLGLMVLSPANAQTNSASEGRELGAFALGAGTINLGRTPETGPNAATLTPKTNEKVESDSGTEPESDPNAAILTPKTNENVESDSGTEPASDPNAPATPETNEKAESELGTQPESNPSTAQPESETTGANSELTQDGSQILINIDKSRQEMTVFVDGIEQYTWPVSTGGPGHATPSGDFTASSMNDVWYSKQWDNAPMPNSIFFTKEGHAIHGSYETKKLGRAVSHGCVRLAPENAKTLYALVEEQGLGNTKVVLSGVTPGGEAKVTSQARSKNRNRQAGTAWYDTRDYYYPPQRRDLFGRRWFGGPYYDGPQGYYRPN
jgi:lipoprotein-anchoring transpeptidase ErfK/SrfK